MFGSKNKNERVLATQNNLRVKNARQQVKRKDIYLFRWGTQNKECNFQCVVNFMFLLLYAPSNFQNFFKSDMNLSKWNFQFAVHTCLLDQLELHSDLAGI